MKKRRDGYRVSNLDYHHFMLPYIKKDRCDSDVYSVYKFDMTNVVKYLKNKRENDKESHLTYFHIFVMVVGKYLYNRPKMNRFVVNKTTYQRNKVQVSFVGKESFTDDASLFMKVLDIEPDDNLDTISKKCYDIVKNIRDKKDEMANTAYNKVAKLPFIIRVLAMYVAKILDRADLLPKSFIKDNYFYSSVLITDVGSLGNGPVYHDLANFGTNSIIFGIGKIHKEKIINENNEEVIRDICDVGVTIDERIGDGFYFIKSLQLIQKIFDNPELLEEACSTLIDDDELKQ